MIPMPFPVQQSSGWIDLAQIGGAAVAAIIVMSLLIRWLSKNDRLRAESRDRAFDAVMARTSDAFETAVSSHQTTVRELLAVIERTGKGHTEALGRLNEVLRELSATQAALVAWLSKGGVKADGQ